MKAILVIGYGSSLPYAAETLEAQADRLRQLQKAPVYTAYDRVNRPDIPSAVQRLAADGIEETAVIPFFIADGVITREHIPAKLGLPQYGDGTAQVGGRPLRFRFGRAVGSDPRVAGILQRRAAEAGATPASGLLVIGHGSVARENAAVTEEVARQLRAAGYVHTEIGYNEFCGPSIEEALGKLMDAGVPQITVLPLFIACGLHLKEEIPAKLGLPAGKAHGTVVRNGRSVPLVYAPAIGPDPLLAEVMANEAAQLLDRSD